MFFFGFFCFSEDLEMSHVSSYVVIYASSFGKTNETITFTSEKPMI